MKLKPKRIIVGLALAVAIFLAKSYWDSTKDSARQNEHAKSTEKIDVSRKLGQITFTPCSLSQSTQAISAFCGILEVPENHNDTSGRMIRLSIAWLAANNISQPDPIFMLAGGPGQSAKESFPQIASAFREVRKSRDVILVDQRGTGDSSPLKCDADETAGKDDKDPVDVVATAASAKRCADKYATNVDVRQFSTDDAVIDLEIVRRAIGASQINLIGISYGTRVAQQYAKKYPQSVRTITLDGVAPTEIVLGQDHAKNLEDSLELQFQRCTSDKSCKENVGNPREELDKLLATLRKGPIPVNYRDALNGEHKSGNLHFAQVAQLTRLLAYAPQTASLLPLQFREANAGHAESLMALIEMISHELESQMMFGMQLSVMCGEDVPDLVVEPNDEALLLGSTIVQTLKTQCDVWPHKERPTDFRDPLTGNLPVLLLSGEFDPVTPPAYGEIVAKHLPFAKHIVAKGQGHNVIGIGCIPKLFAKFLETADAKELDTSCVDALTYSPTFTGFYGWQP